LARAADLGQKEADMHSHSWRQLTFLHWRVDAAALRPLVPAPLEIDAFDGSAWVGLVLFTMPVVRVSGLLIPTAHNFHETNVRTYVRCAGRAGVHFFSLDAASALAVIGARSFWGLPYHHARMRLDATKEAITYASERRWPGPRPAEARVRVQPTGVAAASQPGTRAHFLLERYHLFNVRGRRVKSGEVVHSPYPAQPATLLSCEQTLLAAAGIAVSGPPDDVCFSAGVDVTVRPLVVIV
jgi:uncharacterized protein YqjF (DUF2071 family)